MGDDLDAIDNAEITFCVEQQSNFKDRYGHGRIPIRVLPWAFVRFNDSTSRDYVMPLPPQAIIAGSGINSGLIGLTLGTETDRPLYYRFGRAFVEYMPFRPFPLESAQKARSNTDPGGDIAVHFFGGV